MRTVHTPRLAWLAAVGGMATILAIPMAAAATNEGSQTTALDRMAQFQSAAQRSGVPIDLLTAVSYQQARWNFHGGAPSTLGSYGPMGLFDVPAGAVTPRGDDQSAQQARQRNAVTRQAASAAATDVASIKADPAANISAGAALLARYAKDGNGGRLPADLNGWYDAVAEFSQAGNRAAATTYADSVYALLRQGIRGTSDGGPVSVAAHPEATAQKAVKAKADPKIECPKNLGCDFIPAAYELNDPNDPQNYGNYDLANRPKDVKVTTIVLHDTESSYASTIATFTNPAAYVSAHYVVRSGDGQVTQMVPTKNVAWHAGNWYLNMHSIGIEQEGVAIEGASWYTEQMYRSTASLVKYLARKYDIPLDRQHIIGHDGVPGTTPATIPGMHWDPGPFWDWNYFMALVGAPVQATGVTGKMITVAPKFATNQPVVTDCEGDGSAVPAQGTSFVYLRTAPADDAPLFNDPGLYPAGNGGTTCGSDWGDKASAGQQFVVAQRSGEWLAIWWDGAKVWLKDPAANHTVVKASGLMVVPKPGVAAVATYGRAYPEAAAYPAEIPAQAVVPLPYTITAGQAYVFGGKVPTDYYYAKTIDDSLPGDHTNVSGNTAYYQIQLGHRIAYVQAKDVLLIPMV